MRFIETELKGVFLIEPHRIRDPRGFFARTFCAREFAAYGLNSRFVQCNLSFNARRGTLRGLHFQIPPHTEAKLVRCSRGSIYDAIVDLRPDSPTFGKHYAAELTACDGLSLYIPEGFAHGFQTLEDETEVFYQMTRFHVPDSASGLAYNDPQIGIRWPLPVTVISDRDLAWPRTAHWQNPFVQLSPAESCSHD